MKKRTKKTSTPTNKLLASLGGRVVSVVFKNVKSGIPMMQGLLLDEDANHYYLGESLEVSVAIRKQEVQIIMDAEVLEGQENLQIPPGTKFQ